MPRPRVLVYSQQPRYLSGTLSSLAGEGFEVSGTTSEAEALNKFRTGNYDLLLFGLPPNSEQESPNVLVVARIGGTSLAVPAVGAQPLIALEGRPDGVRYAVGQAKALKEAAEGGLYSPLLAVASPLSGADKPETVLPKLVESLAKLAGSGVWLLVPQGGEGALTIRSTAGGSNPAQPLAAKLGREAIQKGAPWLILEAAAAPADWRPDFAAAGATGGFALPLMLGGQPLGAMAFVRSTGGKLTVQHVQLASLFQPLFALLVEREAKEKDRAEARSSSSELQENLERRQREIRALNTLLQNQQARLLEIEDSLTAQGQRYTVALRSMVNLMETGDPARGGPSESVANWMLALAKPLGLPPDGLADAAYLHDLGMPRGPSNQAPKADEHQRVLRHPFLAEQVAESLGLPLEVRLALKHHHEDFDGSGYPDGLSGQDIPQRARLLRVADALVSFTTSPGKPLAPREALARLKGGVGREYDPQVVDALSTLVTEKAGGPESEVISTVSHELRSPLVFLVGYSELLAAQKDLPADAREKAQEIYQEAVHMSSLVDDLLSVSRYESGRVEFHWQQVDMAELVKRAATKARAKSTEASGHRIEVRLPATPLSIQTDPDKLAQVLDNLLDNAIKYSPNGGQITVSGERRNGEVWLSVSDQGIGIPRDKQERLFEKFYRVDSPLKDTVPGTGLGLHLSQHIVKAHGGRMWLDSVEGKGSTFSIALPDTQAA